MRTTIGVNLCCWNAHFSIFKYKVILLIGYLQYNYHLDKVVCTVLSSTEQANTVVCSVYYIDYEGILLIPNVLLNSYFAYCASDHVIKWRMWKRFLLLCKGISKLLLRLSTLTYYNFFFFCFMPLSRVLYVVYISV